MTIKDLQSLRQIFTTIDRFTPVERLVYGFVTLFFGGILSGVIIYIVKVVLKLQ